MSAAGAAGRGRVVAAASLGPTAQVATVVHASPTASHRSHLPRCLDAQLAEEICHLLPCGSHPSLLPAWQLPSADQMVYDPSELFLLMVSVSGCSGSSASSFPGQNLVRARQQPFLNAAQKTLGEHMAFGGFGGDGSSAKRPKALCIPAFGLRSSSVNCTVIIQITDVEVSAL